MNVRRRLVSGFAGISLFVLLLFGVVSFRATVDLEKDQELVSLRQFAQAGAQTLVMEPGELSQEKVLRLFPESLFQDDFVALRLSDGTTFFNRNLNEFAGQAFAGEVVESMFAEDKPFGKQRLAGAEYLWARYTLKGGGARLLILHHEQHDYSEYSVKLGSRLFITAFIIVWLAVWVALILSKRIVQRLDQQNEALVHQALFDELTDLPNRRNLFDFIRSLIADPKSGRFALLVIDINNFKEINDTLGHAAGDELLIRIAKRLPGSVKDALMVARLGGDEFAVVIPGASRSNISHYAYGLQHTFTMPCDINGLDIVVAPCIGCAYFPDDSSEANVLISRAEVAMYKAKQERVLYLNYDADFDPHNVRRLSLMGDLRHSISKNQLVAYYQPKVGLEDNRVTGVEVLVRWHHPEHGLVSPDDFIPFAEQSDFIYSLTMYTLEQAIIQARRWLDKGSSINVAVNLSTNALQDTSLPQRVKQLLVQHNLPVHLLKLEITESGIMSDPERALSILHTLHDMDVALSIDDFGTGHSSLVYLKQLPVKELKIDKAFVCDVLTDENDQMIVRSTIELAHNLGFKVVAEGVESREIYDYLKACHCDYAQGYHISRPVCAEDFSTWLQRCEWRM